MQRCRVLLFRSSVLCLAIALLHCSSSTKSPVVVPSSGHDFIYTANAGGSTGMVSAFSTDRTSGALTAVAGSPFSTGSGSYALATDLANKFLFVANDFSGDISAFTINTSTGVLTPVAALPYPAEIGMNSLVVDPTGTNMYAVSARSGNLYAYSIASSGALSSMGYPIVVAGSGSAADWVVLSPNGAYLYVIIRDSLAAGIFGFSRDLVSGALTPLAGLPVRLDGMASTAAFDPAGKVLLVTGTGIFGPAGGVSVFSLDNLTGQLTSVSPAVQVGTDPSGVVLDGTGKFVYIPNTGDATISAFTLDASGGLTPIGLPVPSGGNGTINGPQGIAVDSAGRFVFVCNASNDISVFSINPTSGALTAVSGSPFSAGGNGPHAIIWVRGTS
jgi:6-phosphogluconolactonase